MDKNEIGEYINKQSWLVKENANSTYSISGLMASLGENQIKKYLLEKIYTAEISEAHTKGYFHIHDLGYGIVGYCFTGDTRVKLLDGTNPTFKELTDNYDGKPFWVYSNDGKGNIVPGLAHSPRLTRHNEEICKVEIDNGEIIECTKDHKFLMRDGSYKEAQNLKENDSLMPLYESQAGNYMRLSNQADKKRYYTHRKIAQEIYGDITGKVVHHLNGNKMDNRPENLVVMEDAEHRKQEILKTMESDLWKDNNKKRLTIFNKSTEKRKQVSQLSKNRERMSNGTWVKQRSDEISNNHKVVAVHDTIVLENVYDLTVEKYHNFALDAGIFVHNCAGWSLRQLLEEGYNGVANKVQSAPPKHFRTALGQMVNFLGTLQMEFAGAQAFSSFDTYLAPYIARDKLTYKQVKQGVQEFVFNLNVPSRWAGQAPFTNITLDWTVPEDMKDRHPVIGGHKLEETYSDFKDEMEMLNKAFIEVMIEGDRDGRIFSFPIPTYNITKDFVWDSANAQLLFEMTSKYGIPYFQNFINSTIKPEDVRSMCCRLQLDLRELRMRGNGLFGAGEQTGSIGVVTMNLPKMAYEAKINSKVKDRPTLKKEEGFFTALGHYMDLAKESLETKRTIITDMLKRGLMPYTSRYLGTWDNHFSTIGLLGMNEACLNLMGKDITEKEGYEFAQKTLDFMRDKLSDYQEETGKFYNLEATPAEGTTHRLAKLDKEQYPEIITQGSQGSWYYTNSSQLPVDATNSIFKAIKHQDKLQTKYTGGTVLHVFLGERVTDWINCMMIVKRIAHNTSMPYFTITPTFSVCPVHGYISGEHEFCPLEHTNEDEKKYGMYVDEEGDSKSTL